jgi:hypothetical protein
MIFRSIQQRNYPGSNIMDYLEACIGISPIYDRNLKEIRSLVKASSQLPGPSQPICVVFTLDDGRGSLIKLLRILSTFAKIRFLCIFLARRRFFLTKAYGVYPTTGRPMIVFEMSSNAENYIVKKILPERPSGLNGYLRLWITRLTKINPVLGGVALVIRANT